MITKKLNTIITIISLILYLTMVIYTAVISSRLAWWVIHPNTDDLYMENPDISKFNNSVKYVTNRYPFGEIIAPAKPALPSIVEKIRLTGLYVNTREDSFVFMELDGKPLIGKVGSSIGGEVTIESITPRSIIILDKNNNANEIALSKGAGGAGSAGNTNISGTHEESGKGVTLPQNLLLQHSHQVLNDYLNREPAHTHETNTKPNASNNKTNGNDDDDDDDDGNND